MVSSTILFGLAAFTSDAVLFFSVSVIARISQAIGDATVCVVIPIIFSTIYPSETSKFSGIFLSCVGAGFSFGPCIGSIFY